MWPFPLYPTSVVHASCFRYAQSSGGPRVAMSLAIAGLISSEKRVKQLPRLTDALCLRTTLIDNLIDCILLHVLGMCKNNKLTD